MCFGIKSSHNIASYKKQKSVNYDIFSDNLHAAYFQMLRKFDSVNFISKFKLVNFVKLFNHKEIH